MRDIGKEHFPLKPPKTFEEQLAILSRRGLIIEDHAKALTILSKINYYRFSAYLLPFRDAKTKKYKEVTTFAQVYKVYEFDRRLRSLLQAIIEPIEILLKTRIAYYHGHSYGPEGYTEPLHFQDSARHNKFMEEFTSALRKKLQSFICQTPQCKVRSKVSHLGCDRIIFLGNVIQVLC